MLRCAILENLMGYMWEEVSVWAVLAPFPQYGFQGKPVSTERHMADIYKPGLLYFDYLDAEVEDTDLIAPHTWVVAVYTKDGHPLGWSDPKYSRAADEAENYMKRHHHQHHQVELKGLTVEEVRRRLIAIDAAGTLVTEMALMVPKVQEWGAEEAVEDLAKFVADRIYGTQG